LVANYTVNDNVTVNYKSSVGENVSVRVFQNGTANYFQSYTLEIDIRPFVDDTYEPNDNITSASQLGIGSYSNLIVNASNTDFFKVNVSVHNNIQVTATFNQTDGNIDMELYDPLEASVSSSTTLTDNESLSHNVTTLSGYYYIKVYQVAPFKSYQNYSLTIITTKKDDNYEENDDFSNGASIGNGTHILVSNSTDEDWFNVSVNAGKTLYIDILFDNATGNIDAELYNSTQDLLDSSLTITDNEHLEYEVLSAGNYSVKINQSDVPQEYQLYTLVIDIKDITLPTLENVTKTDPLELGQIETIRVDAWDLYGVDNVTIRINDTVTYYMTNISGNGWEFSWTPTSIGTKNYTIYANDTSGNLNFLSGSIVVNDTTVPNIQSVTENATSLYEGDSVRIDATIIEPSNLSFVYIECEGSNRSMVNVGGNVWRYDWTPVTVGTHNYTIHAKDIYGNLNSTDGNDFVTVLEAPPSADDDDDGNKINGLDSALILIASIIGAASVVAIIVAMIMIPRMKFKNDLKVLAAAREREVELKKITSTTVAPKPPEEEKKEGLKDAESDEDSDFNLP